MDEKRMPCGNAIPGWGLDLQKRVAALERQIFPKKLDRQTLEAIGKAAGKAAILPVGQIAPAVAEAVREAMAKEKTSTFTYRHPEGVKLRRRSAVTGREVVVQLSCNIPQEGVPPASKTAARALDRLREFAWLLRAGIGLFVGSLGPTQTTAPSPQEPTKRPLHQAADHAEDAQ